MLAQKKNLWLTFLVIVVFGLLIFGNGLNGGFVYDDNLVLSHSLFNNPAIFLSFFSESYFEDVPQAGLYRPLTQISFAINFLFSHKPFGFHLVNVFLHSLNSFLVFLLAIKLFNDKKLGWLVAGLFLVLPIHVEAVTSIVGRAELLSFFFGLGAIYLWIDKRYLLTAGALLLALLSKETAVVIPVLLILFSIHFGRKFSWLWYQVISFAIYLVFRLSALGSNSFGVKAEFLYNPLAHVAFFSRIFTAAKVFLLYLQKIFVPYNLSADYSYNQIPVIKSFNNFSGWVGILLLAVLIFIIFKFIRHKEKHFWAIAIAFFLLPYLVISNLIIPVGTIMGERLMYFSSFGAVLVLGWIFNKIIGLRKYIGMAVFVILIVGFGLVTIKQNAVWATEETLMLDSYNKSPNSIITQTNLGVLMLNKDVNFTRRLSLKAYSQYPNHVKNLNLQSALAVIDKDLPKAEIFLERALVLRPYHQGTLENISRVYFTQNKLAEAVKTLETLATRYGGVGNVIFYSVAKIQIGKYQEAIEILDNYFGETANETVQTVKDFAKMKLNLIASNRELEKNYTSVMGSFRYNQ